MPRRFSFLVIVLVLAACVEQPGEAPTGDDGGNQSVASTTTTLGRLGIERRENRRPVVGCLDGDRGQQEGAERMDGGHPESDDDLRTAVDTSTVEFRRALTDCAPILTRVGALDLRRDPELQAVIISQLRAFAECVRGEGIDTFPDPDPAFSGVGSPFPADEVPSTDPLFEAAVETCRDALGSGLLGEG